MAEQRESASLLQVLRREYLPYLQGCRDPGRLMELLDRLAGYLEADGAVLWRAEEDQLTLVALDGCVTSDWARANHERCAGADAWRGGAAVLLDGGHGAYSETSAGLAIEQVVGFPVQGPKGRIGSIEVWWKARPGAERKLSHVREVLPLLEDALNESLPALLEYEAERRNYLSAISRLMMLYDIGKVFHSTLDLEELAPLIRSRIQHILEAEGAAVWLLDPVKKNLYCAAAAGQHSAAMQAQRIWASDPGLGAAASQNEAVMLHEVEDPAWAGRWGGRIRSLVAAPLALGGKFFGALEAIRGAEAPYFTEEDLRLLIDVGKQAAVALRNAQQHQFERRVKELNALMEISKEITATLDLDRVLAATVNRITAVIPADRCGVSLFRKGRWEVSGISGAATVDRKKPEVQELESLHTWLAGSGADLTAARTEEGITAEREETREKLAQYFERSGMRAIVGLLLRDEEGTVGVMTLESKDPLAMNPGHEDLARIFASQATVALRNALLYKQVPLIGVLEPLIEKKAKFSALPAMRRRVILGAAAAALGFLIFFPWRLKPSGEARVLPASVQPASAEVEGVVRRVLVREGDRVEAGQVLAELAPDEHQVALEQARVRQEILSRRVLQLEAAGELGEARLERARLEQASAELELQRTRLAQTLIRSPVTGVLITPRLEERVGQLLARGDVLCQVVEMDRAWTEIAVPEQDIGEVEPGQEAWLKLNTFPERKFVGQVVRISPQGRELSEERVFDVIVEVPNEDQTLRSGMMGRGKILARRTSVAYLLLRTPTRWLWMKVWSWLP